MSPEAAAMMLEAAEAVHYSLARYMKSKLVIEPSRPKPEPIVPCRFDWCDAGHTARDLTDVVQHGEFHRESGIEHEEIGVRRTDHVYANETVSLSIVESTDWEIPAAEAPAFFAKLRASIDEAEHRFNAFVTKIEAVSK